MDIKQEIKDLREKWYSNDKEIFTRKQEYNTLEEIAQGVESSLFSIDLYGYHFECLFEVFGESIF